MTGIIPALSIIIANWNTCSLLRACLDSVFKNAGDIECEVIVVDNGSRDHSADMVARYYPQVLLIRNTENPGFAKANNQGISLCAGRYVLLLNTDTEIMRSALATMVVFMDHHLDVGAVGPKLISRDGTMQTSCDLFPLRPWEIAWQRLFDTICPSNRLTRQGRIALWTYKEPLEVDWILGAALLVRREVIDQVGGLDEDFWMYGEDLEWCYRIKQASWKVFYLPDALIYHIHGGSSQFSSELRQLLAKQRDDSLVLFYRKHYGSVPALGLRLILARKRLTRRLFGHQPW